MSKINNFIELNKNELTQITGGIDPETVRNALLIASLFGGSAILATGTVVLLRTAGQVIYDAATN